MNYASDDQMTAVAQSCRDFRNSSKPDFFASDEEVSCEICQHWDGERCTINVFDRVLTSLDQT